MSPTQSSGGRPAGSRRMFCAENGNDLPDLLQPRGGRRAGSADAVHACLFDLDGVLTDTARVHTRAWKAMFDAYLRDRTGTTGTAFVPFDAAADYQKYVDGKKRADGVRSFLASRGIELPDGTPPTPRHRDRQRAGEPQERAVPENPARRRRRGVRGLRRYLQAVHGAGLPAAVVSSSANTVRCSDHRPGPVRTASGRRRHFARRADRGQARTGLLSARRRTARCAARGRRCSRTPWPVCRPAATGGSAWSSAWTGSDAQKRCGTTAPTSSSPTWPNCWSPGDQRRRLSGRALAGPRDRSRAEPARADRIAVRPVQRPHRSARQSGRRRTARDTRHLSELVLRGAAAAVRRGGLRRRRTVRRSSTSPTAR